MDLSVIIPSRHEQFLRRTVEDVLAHARGDTEVIAIVDGATCSSHPWANPDLLEHPRLRVERLTTVVGQRAATNLAARLARGRYVMKLDAHCSVAEGFDVALVTAGDALGHDVTQIPRMYNLHGFNWRCAGCGTETYQGPTPCECAECRKQGKPGGPFARNMLWAPRLNRRTDFARFDHELHFQYVRKHKPKAEGDIYDVMTSVGACFVMRRTRFEELGGLDEAHGSWGQFGVEIACKSWLSGGRHVVNTRTWFAHLFRTQGGDFGFPYRMSGTDQDRSRAHSRALWLDNTWPQQVRPLSWLIEKFAPLEDWHDPVGVAALARVQAAGMAWTRAQRPLRTSAPASTKGIIYYSDGRIDRSINGAVQDQIARAGLPVVACARGTHPMRADWQHVIMDAERGYLTMFRQILAALEASTADVIFHCEHDVLYHPSHFDFTPERDDTFYYNQNVWKVSAEDGRALHYLCRQVSGLCASRSLLIDHYRKRVALVEQHGFSRELGFEPGTNKAQRVFETRGSETWMSSGANIDVRHGKNLTKTRWSQAEFRNKSTCLGWTEADEVPGWGRTRGRFTEFLAGVGAAEVAA